MFLQTSTTNRRQFLERSVLGAGSVLFLPGLLAGCTDHAIPGPEDTPSTSWPLADTDGIDWNHDAKRVVVLGLKQVPEYGEILSPLAEIFWPDKQPSVWDQVKAQTETLVNKKIADNVYQTVSDDLGGLHNNITIYLNELKNYNDSVTAYQKDPTKPKPDPTDVRGDWLTAKNFFANYQPHFQSSGYELPLLGLFAQFANMYLAILRDGVAFGQSWGRSDADHQQDIKDLKTAITNFSIYGIETFGNGSQDLLSKTPTDNGLCEPFRTVNAYQRGMTLTVLDFLDTWQYYDVTTFPNGAKNPDGTPINMMPREIYADPLGTCIDSGPINLPSPPTQGPTNLTVWGDTYLVDAVQLTYPAGSGPNGVTQTGRMGNPDHDKASTQPPSGGSFTISPDNPIIQFRGGTTNYKAAVAALQFRFYDGTTTSILGGNTEWLTTYPAYTTYPDEFMSSIHINGISSFWGVADCAVIGFKYWQSPAATLNAIQTLYVRSPKEHSLADFAQAYPNLPMPAITDELKAARAAYWASVSARAKALK